MLFRRVLPVLFLLLPWMPAWAQKEFNTWCFGTGYTNRALPIKVRFAEGGPLAADTCGWLYTIVTGSGNATISDADGNMILYTDGLAINHRHHRRMLNGLLDDPRVFSDYPYERGVQPTAIAPGPDGLYYVFYWTLFREGELLSYNLTYAVVDARLQNGDGAVVSKGHVLTRTTKARVTIVRHQNNRDFWVITRDLDARGFQAFLLSRGGVSATPVPSLAGQAAAPTHCELKASPDGRRLVCSGRLPQPGNTSAEYICVYDFDNATGVVSHELALRRLPYQSGGILEFLTASFSPSSQLLYTAETNPNIAAEPPTNRRVSDIWQYDLRGGTPAEIERARFKVSDVPLRPGPDENIGAHGLQLSPDRTLWAAGFYGHPQVDPVTHAITRLSAAIIRRPDVPGPGCGFEAEAYPYQPGQAPSIVLPNVITNMLYAPATLNLAAACPEDSVQFWASSAGPAAGLRWDFGEPAAPDNNASGRQVAHRYAHGGSYTVRLTLANGRVLTRTVTVTADAIDFTGANIFTPNADGLNDEFVPVAAPLAAGRLRIYSRWGQLIHQTTDQPLRWNGSNAAAGTYFYQLDYTDCGGHLQYRRGQVSMVR